MSTSVADLAPPLINLDTLPDFRAWFAWSDAPRSDDLTVHLFRRTLIMAEVPATFRIVVSADSRYVLWLNGERLGRGPLKGTLQHHHAETYELAPRLRPGVNVLAVEVRWFGRSSPTSEVHSSQPGLFVQGLDDPSVDTPGDWRVSADHSVTSGWDDPFNIAHAWIGPMDRIDAARRPRHWKTTDFNDAAWPVAKPVGSSLQPIGWGLSPTHQLKPREIPALIEEPRDFSRVLLNREPSTLPWTVPADATGELWLDAGALTTSYPVLDFTGGAGRELHIVYAEALGHWRDEKGNRNWVKSGLRHDVANALPHGYRDVLILPGRDHRFEPFHWRTFWFIKLTVLPGAEPVTLRTIGHRFTTFPQTFTARFTCADPDIERLWSISLHTLQLCAHETYEDCPYFEQLNYIGDARLQAMCSHYLANDPRMGRRCLRLFRDSLSPDGLTASRAPGVGRQVIPMFSLHWIMMLDDHWQWVGADDRAFLQASLGAVDAILRHFRDRLAPNGFVGRIDDWAWIDATPGWKRGVSPAVAAGTGSTGLTALFILTLDAAARLHRGVGIPAEAERWVDLAHQLRRTLQAAWSEAEGLFIEGPGRETDPFSQHTQSMVILAGAANPTQQTRIAARLVDDPTLVPMSLFHRYYLARALARIGRYNRFLTAVLQPWRQMLADGLSTWQEFAGTSRSDCHAWSSWITVAFLADFLGARPGAPGWTSIHIEPQFTATTSAEGDFPTPAGRLSIKWHTRPDQQIDLAVVAPVGVPVTVTLPGQADQTFPTGGPIRLLVQLCVS